MTINQPCNRHKTRDAVPLGLCKRRNHTVSVDCEQSRLEQTQSLLYVKIKKLGRGSTQTCNFHVSEMVEKNVIELEVSVCDSFCMTVLEALNHLPKQLTTGHHWQWASVHNSVDQIALLGIFNYQEKVICSFNNFVQTYLQYWSARPELQTVPHGNGSIFSWQ